MAQLAAQQINSLEVTGSSPAILLLYFFGKGFVMNKKLMKFADKVLAFGSKNNAEILTGLALVGLMKTIYDVYKVTPEINKIMKDAKEDMKIIRPGDKSAKRAVVKETVKKLVVKTAPVFLDVVFTGGCTIASNRASNKKLAVMSAAYEISNGALQDLNKKMKEVVGERKAREIKDAVVKEKVDKDPPTEANTVIVSGKKDEVLCKDCHSGRYFYGNAQKLQKAILDLSVQCFQEEAASLNDLYYLLGIPQTPDGHKFGWRDVYLVNNMLPIYISAQLTEDQEPCLCLDYDAYLI